MHKYYYLITDILKLQEIQSKISLFKVCWVGFFVILRYSQSNTNINIYIHIYVFWELHRTNLDWHKTFALLDHPQWSVEIHFQQFKSLQRGCCKNVFVNVVSTDVGKFQQLKKKFVANTTTCRSVVGQKHLLDFFFVFL